MLIFGLKEGNRRRYVFTALELNKNVDNLTRWREIFANHNLLLVWMSNFWDFCFWFLILHRRWLWAVKYCAPTSAILASVLFCVYIFKYEQCLFYRKRCRYSAWSRRRGRNRWRYVYSKTEWKPTYTLDYFYFAGWTIFGRFFWFQNLALA